MITDTSLYKFSKGPLKGHLLDEVGLSWEIATVGGKQLAVFNDGTTVDFYVDQPSALVDRTEAKERLTERQFVSDIGTGTTFVPGDNTGEDFSLTLGPFTASSAGTVDTTALSKRGRVRKTSEELKAAYPHIYGPYPENLAKRNWLQRLFSWNADAENAARDAEWNCRIRMASLLKLPPPPPPNELIKKGI